MVGKVATPADIVAEADAVMKKAEADMAAEGAIIDAKAETLIDATDLAIQMAKDYKVSLADIKGTGKGGRVIVPDVDKFVKARDAAAAEPVEADAPVEVVEAKEEKPRPIKKLVAASLLPNVIVGLTDIYHIIRTISDAGMGWYSSRVSVEDADEELGKMLSEGWELIHSQPLGYSQDGIEMFWVMGKFAEGKVERFPYCEIHHKTLRVGGGSQQAVSGAGANALISGYLQSGWDLALVEALDKSGGGAVNVMWIMVR